MIPTVVKAISASSGPVAGAITSAAQNLALEGIDRGSPKPEDDGQLGFLSMTIGLLH